MFLLLQILFILSCHNEEPMSEYSRDRFEGQWWELQSYPICIMMHESGDFLTYEEHIISQGYWEFQEPNLYLIDDEEFYVTQNEGCWDIEYAFMSGIVCECSLR